jgi:hypothetical protein
MSSTREMFSISQIRCALTALMKFPLVAPILIRAIALICDLPILQRVVKGTSGSKLGTNKEAVICAILPLETSLLEASLFPYLHVLEWK